MATGATLLGRTPLPVSVTQRRITAGISDSAGSQRMSNGVISRGQILTDTSVIVQALDS